MGLIAADDMSQREQAILFEFTRDVADAAFRAGYLMKAWQPNDAMCLRLRGYHQAGLSPDEAADGLFAVHH
ncbi:UNVERIFIED_ORG: hypothetical protein ABIC54_004471 [Burkholderia sp. 1263]|jgi:hypothetical protein